MIKFGAVFVCCVVAALFHVSSGRSLVQRNRLIERPYLVCDKTELEDKGYSVNFCDGVEGDYVDHGSSCIAVEVDSGATVDKQCVDGMWKSYAITRGSPDTIKKRDWGVFAGIFAAVACLVLCRKSSSSSNVVTRTPPKFETNCTPNDLQQEYTADIGTESTTVTWKDKPSATDDDGAVRSVEQVSGGLNGSRFDGSPTGLQHLIAYRATDNDGLTDSCYFSFKVKVETCSALPRPSNGYRKCPIGDILGSSCIFGCNTGYQLTPNVDTVRCARGSSGTEWSTIPTCEKVKCGAPPNVTDGVLTCNDPEYTFSSYCTVACSNGFELNGPVYTKCEAVGSWSGVTPSTCTDDTPPELSCITLQVFYADSGSQSTFVSWIEPSATDFLDPNAAVIQTSGPDPGALVEAGTSVFATYKATDTAGNESPECTIESRVLAISCGHPLDTLEDTRLTFDCSMSTYTLGDTCTLDCDLNLPLVGTDLVTCESNNSAVGEPRGYWDWESGDTPYCQDIACPDLLPPKNGALVFDTVNSRPVNTMLCEDSFDIPRESGNFYGIFICQDSGSWTPNYTKAPDCIEPFIANRFRLPAELFYYSGTCGVDDNITARFEAIVQDLDTIFPALCPPGVICTAANPRITCGDTSGRRRRETEIPSRPCAVSPCSTTYKMHSVEKRQTSGDTMVGEFDIMTEFDFINMIETESLQFMYDYVDNIQLNILKPAVEEKVYNGSFDIDNWGLHSDSFQTAQYGEFYCEPGSTRSGNTYVCKPCSLGRYDNDGTCTLCPIGQYSDTTGATICTNCPDGYSTRRNAAESSNNCTQLCTPGTYSPDTFAPCAQCKLGFYQALIGQTACVACPAGKSTATTGSTSVTDCQYFDVKLENTNGEEYVANIRLASNITITFWSKKVSESTPSSTSGSTPSSTQNSAVISIGYLDLVIEETIRIDVMGGSPVSLDIGPSSNKWTFSAVEWDTTNNLLSTFYKGETVTSAVSVPPPSSQDVPLTIEAAASKGILLSGFSIRNELLTWNGISQAKEACQQPDASNEIASMDDLRSLSQQGVEGLNIITPSACDAIDECEGDPCGTHKCTNTINGFICTCFNHWSGPTCNIPPDWCNDNDCENGATCINSLTDYSCQCPLGYTGSFCEFPPVDGGWSAWTRWSECTMTCNSGTRQRTRTCDNPLRDMYGQDCVGDTMETEACNTELCKECPYLERGFGTLLNCTTSSTTGSSNCTVTCKDGYDRPSGLEIDTYTCGLDTNYEWQPFDQVTDCVKPERPIRFNVSVSAQYNSQISTTDELDVQDAVISNARNTDCFNALTCQTSVAINNNSGNGSTITLSFAILLTDTSDLQFEDYTANGTVSTALQEVIDAINNLESTASAINSSASSIFDVTVNDTTYTVDQSAMTFDGSATCPSGQVLTDALCVDCPVGSFKDGDYCSFCERGTYQNQTGQSSCTSCPTGYTTAVIGSESVSDCLVECPAGSFKDGDYCSFCERGTYQNQTGQSSCTPCPAGYTTAVIGSKSVSDCSGPTTTFTTSTTSRPTTTSTTSTTSRPTTTSTTSTTLRPTTTTTPSTTSRPTTTTTTSTTSRPITTFTTSTTSRPTTTSTTSTTSRPTTTSTKSTTSRPTTTITTSTTSRPTITTTPSTTSRPTTTFTTSTTSRPTTTFTKSTTSRPTTTSTTSTTSRPTTTTITSTTSRPTTTTTTSTTSRPTTTTTTITTSRPTTTSTKGTTSGVTSTTTSSTAASTTPGARVSSTISTIPSASPGLEPGESGDSKALYIGVPIAAVSLVISITTVALFCAKKHKSQNAEVLDSNADINRTVSDQNPPVLHSVPTASNKEPSDIKLNREPLPAVSIIDLKLEEVIMPAVDSPGQAYNTPAVSQPEYCSYLYD